MYITKFMNFIDKISERTGSIISWLSVWLAIVVLYEVFSRYILNSPTIWAYDTSWMLFSVIFLMGGSYTLLHKRHVRIDVIYSRFLTIKGQIIFDIIFYLVILIPIMVMLTIKGVEFATLAWVMRENLSTTMWTFPAGPVKTAIPMGFFLMALQGIAELIRCYKALMKGEKP